MHDEPALYLDGQWQAARSGEWAEVIDPSSAAVAGRFPNGGVEDVDRAVQAARRAFPAWSALPSQERARWIGRLADALADRADEMADLITTELGMPVRWCREVQVEGPLEGLRSYQDLAAAMDHVEQIGNARVVREAIGVCAFINPWNYPLHQMIGKLAPALAAGCTVVAKPSQETPLHAFLLARIIDHIGLPPGVFNLVTGPGAVVGEALARHPDVDMVSFTGSTGAGARVAQSAADTVKRVCLELGGKSPFIITADADLDAAVRHGVQNVMINSGQTCTALTRMLVPREHYRQVLDIACDEVARLKLGHPRDPDTFMGPICSAAQLRTIRRYLELAREEGARFLTDADAGLALGEGFYQSPVLLADVTPQMRVVREEIFGPVLCILPFSDEDDAIRQANDSPFGLSSAVWSGSVSRAEQLAARLRAGQCFLNGADFNYRAPFGGYRQSGNGREWGEHGLAEFWELKAVMRPQ